MDHDPLRDVGEPTVTAGAVDLLRRVKEVDDALLRRDIANRNQLFGRVREALSALSEIHSMAALVAKVPELACCARLRPRDHLAR